MCRKNSCPSPRFRCAPSMRPGMSATRRRKASCSRGSMPHGFRSTSACVGEGGGGGPGTIYIWRDVVIFYCLPTGFHCLSSCARLPKRVCFSTPFRARDFADIHSIVSLNSPSLLVSTNPYPNHTNALITRPGPSRVSKPFPPTTCTHRVLHLTDDGSERRKGVHGHLGLGGRDAAQKGRLPRVGVAHQPHVGDGAQLELVEPALSTLPG